MLEQTTNFQIYLLALPSRILRRSSSVDELASLSPSEISDSLMSLPFEVFADRLKALDRMYFEMDGSFVWTGDQPQPWQLDGMVYDVRQQIQRVELKGQCPHSEWQKLLCALDYPSQALIAYDLQSSQFTTIENLSCNLWPNPRP